MEIEAKFTIPDEATYARLAACHELAGFRLEPGPTVTDRDQYMDTPSRRFLAGGYACRLRREGDTILMTLKGLGNAAGELHRRDEREVRLPAFSPHPEHWPDSPARWLAVELAAGDPLQPLVEIVQTRARRLVYDGERLVGELTLDAVTPLVGTVEPEGEERDGSAGAPLPAQDDSARMGKRYWELEVELKDGGTEADLQNLSHEWAQQWGLVPQPRSKFERALEAIGEGAQSPRTPLVPAEPALRAVPQTAETERVEPRPAAETAGEAAAEERQAEKPVKPKGLADATYLPPKPDDPMSEAGRRIMHLHFQRMCQNEAGTRAGEDREALHDMRVATRRMRAAYDIFEPYYEPKTVRRFKKGLRQTGHALGDVRDLDVLLEKMQRYVSDLPAEQGRALQPLIDDWRSRREKARDEMLAYLDSRRYQDFKVAFETLLTTPGAGAVCSPANIPAPSQVRHVVPSLLFTRYEEVRVYETLLPGASLTTYHQLRIACKKLRYALEFFADVLGSGAGGLIKQVTAMQDLLGDLHDAVVSEGLAAEFLAEQVQKRPVEQHPPDLQGVAAYLSAQWSIQHSLLGKFPKQWESLSGSDFRRELSLAVATL